MLKIKKSKRNFNQKGFSLVELLVTTSIFVIVALVTVSAMTSLNDANKKAQTMRAIMDNLNFAVENMARSLRTGTNYNCPGASSPNCPNGENSISFKASTGDTIMYFLDGGTNQIIKRINAGSGLPITPHITNPLGGIQPLEIDYLEFYVTGATAGDSQQPRIVIVAGGTARYNEKIETKFQIQTSVSQRVPDF